MRQPGSALIARLQLNSAVADLGLRQLGTTCTAPDPDSPEAPTGKPI